MGLKKSGMTRFGRMVNAAMEDLFPGAVEIGGVSYECACSGGRSFRDFDEHGLPVTRKMRTIRVRRELLATVPAVGVRVKWTPEDGSAVDLRVVETPDRPHEEAWAIVCQEQ